jgi:hypothetical protein
VLVASSIWGDYWVGFGFNWNSNGFDLAEGVPRCQIDSVDTMVVFFGKRC